MPFDPKPTDRAPQWRPQLHRRDVLRLGALAALGLGASPLLAACSRDSTGTAAPGASGGTGDGPYPLARPNAPVTLPLFAENPAIASGQQVEKVAALRILNYADYINPKVKKDFAEKYDVEIQVTPYNNYDEMLTKLTAPGAAFDVVFPGPSYLSRMVYAQLLQPFQQSYLTNLGNVWDEYQNPWYDQGSQYTVPYVVYTTGVGYRADRVSDPAEGYKMLWNDAYAGKLGVIDDSSEALAMAMLAWGITREINTADPALVAAAQAKLDELIPLGVDVGVNQFQTISSGQYTVHQAWSGDMIAATGYLPKGVSTDVLGYWAPEANTDRVIGGDNMAIPKSSPSPVLAHTFINELLDNEIAERNFSWNGYQPPLKKLSADYLIAQGYIPDNLLSAVVVPQDFVSELQFFEVSPAVSNMWLAAFQSFQSGGN